MRLARVDGVVAYGHWATGHGFAVTEGPAPFGPVHRVHSVMSLHYKDPPRALDINYYGGDELDRLRWLYERTLRFKRRHPSFPLDELWFDGLGYVKEYGVDVNHPISGHEGHLHIGFTRVRWRLTD